MEPVLLGLVAPSIGAAGNLLDRTAQAATRPFATLLRTAAKALDRGAEPAVATTSENHGVRTHAEHLQRGGTDAQGLSLQEMRETSATMKNRLEQRIRDALEQAGIPLDGPLVFSISEIDSSIELLTDHQQRALIESVLAQDFELSAEIHELIALESLLSFADTDEEFRTALEQNPLQAIAQYGAQLGHRATVELVISPLRGAEHQPLG